MLGILLNCIFFIFGGCFGVVIMALMVASSNADQHSKNIINDDEGGRYGTNKSDSGSG